MQQIKGLIIQVVGNSICMIATGKGKMRNEGQEMVHEIPKLDGHHMENFLAFWHRLINPRGILET